MRDWIFSMAAPALGLASRLTMFDCSPPTVCREQIFRVEVMESIMLCVFHQ